jgi:molybdopterin molybdotransferase
MVSVCEAKKIIEENTKPLAASHFPLEAAGGKTLAENIYAAFDIPAFPQSSMDGYAFSFAGWQQYKQLHIEGESAAGNRDPSAILPGQAMRIFTGAPIPTGADTVVMQEKIKTENGLLLIDDEKLQAGNNVRAAGSEIRKGALGLASESLLTPAAIGFLAGIGLTSVSAYPLPAVTIIITGDELQQPGRPLSYGQVYESNSFTLKTILRQTGIEEVQVLFTDDKPESVITALNNALSQSDLVLLTGGISVGDYDFVLQAAKANNVEQLFHKVKQRPGKPLYFGIKENKLVFGLPGNPSSVLTCFYQYVLPAISLLSKKDVRLKSIKAPLAKSIQKNTNLTHFLKGIYNEVTVAELDGQESYKMNSFAKANCLIQVNEESTLCKEGEWVEIHLL